MSDLGPARSIVLLALFSYYIKLPFFTKINSKHVAFSYCACSTSYSGWAYNRVKIPSCKNFEAKEGMGVYSRWAYFREGTVLATY